MATEQKKTSTKATGTSKKSQAPKKEAKKEDIKNKPINLLDILLDEDNVDPITLTDEDGNKTAFEQICVVPLDNEIYVILKPLEEVEGVGDDEALVFKLVSEKNGGSVLIIEEDDKIGEAVFNEYYKLLDETEE